MDNPTFTKDLNNSIKKIEEFTRKELENYPLIQKAGAFEMLGKIYLSQTIFFLNNIYGENNAKAHAQGVIDSLMHLFDNIIKDSLESLLETLLKDKV